jgi:hypothetical protein
MEVPGLMLTNWTAGPNTPTDASSFSEVCAAIASVPAAMPPRLSGRWFLRWQANIPKQGVLSDPSGVEGQMQKQLVSRQDGHIRAERHLRSRDQLQNTEFEEWKTSIPSCLGLLKIAGVLITIKYGQE